MIAQMYLSLGLTFSSVAVPAPFAPRVDTSRSNHCFRCFNYSFRVCFLKWQNKKTILKGFHFVKVGILQTSSYITVVELTVVFNE